MKSKIPNWYSEIWKEEYNKMREFKTMCIYSLKGLPEVFQLDIPENLYEGFWEKHPDTAIILCSIW